MEFIDISVPIYENTIVWRDDNPPRIDWQKSMSQGHPANVSAIKIGTHTGTHIDAPFHFINEGIKVHEIDLSLLMGKTLVASAKSKTLSYGFLDSLNLPPLERILLNTGNSELFKEKSFNQDFAALDESGADWIIERGIKVVGIDYLSIEHCQDNSTYPVHKKLLNHNVVIIEGLNLSGVQSGWYRLMALPLKLMGTEGAPARVLLFPPD